MSGFVLLFDLDGTLAHSDGLHYIAFQRYCEKYMTDFTLSEEFFEKNIHGRSNADIFPTLLNREVIGDELKLFADEKEACYRQLVREIGISAIDGGSDFMRWARAEGMCVGIVTNAPRLNAESMLAALNMTDTYECLIIGMVCTTWVFVGTLNYRLFCSVLFCYEILCLHCVTGEECAAMKPSPVPYLDGAKSLGADISRCIVFEDSPAGMKAAVAAAPLAVVGLTSTLTAKKLMELGADLAIDTFCGEKLKDFVRERINIPVHNGE